MQIGKLTLLVRDYDEAIAWYTRCLGFELAEDIHLGGPKRWVVVKAPGQTGGALLLARAVGEEQNASVGRQAGGRVFLFLETDDFDETYAKMQAEGVPFREAPRSEPYGKVAVFEDLYGNAWDLIETRG